MTKPGDFESIAAEAAASGGVVHVRVGRDRPLADVWLAGGDIVGARTEGGDERLGRRLAAIGLIAAEEVRTLQASARRESVPLAYALAGRVRRDALEEAGNAEVGYAVAAAVASSPDQLVRDDAQPAFDAWRCHRDARELVDEARAYVTRTRIAQQHVRPTSTLKQLGFLSIDDMPTDLERAVLAKSDGISTVEDVARACGLPHPEVSLIALSLRERGLVAVDAAAGAAPGPAAPAGASPPAPRAVTGREARPPVATPALESLRPPVPPEEPSRPKAAEPTALELAAAALLADAAPAEDEGDALEPEIAAVPAATFEPEKPEPEKPKSAKIKAAPDNVRPLAGVDTQELLRELASIGRADLKKEA